MSTITTTVEELRDQCDSTYERIQEWRDAPDAFNVQDDRMYLHGIVESLQDDARKLGCTTTSNDDPTTDQALNIVAEIIEWCESQSEPKGSLPSSTTIKEWYTPNELAELVGKSAFTVREKWCNAGRIDCEKDLDSGKWRISGSEVKRLANGGSIMPKR